MTLLLTSFWGTIASTTPKNSNINLAKQILSSETTKTESLSPEQQQRIAKWKDILPVLEKWINRQRTTKRWNYVAAVAITKNQQTKTYHLIDFPWAAFDEKFTNLPTDFYPQLDALIADKIDSADLNAAFDNAQKQLSDPKIRKSYQDVFLEPKYRKIILDSLKRGEDDALSMKRIYFSGFDNFVNFYLKENANLSSEQKWAREFTNDRVYKIEATILAFLLAGVTAKQAQKSLDEVAKIQGLWQEIKKVLANYDNNLSLLEINNKIYVINSLVKNRKISDYTKINYRLRHQIEDLYYDQISPTLFKEGIENRLQTLSQSEAKSSTDAEETSTLELPKWTRIFSIVMSIRSTFIIIAVLVLISKKPKKRIS